jgi:hypothetical protein
MPPIAIRTTTDDSSIVLLDHVLEEKLEGCENVSVIARGLYELLPDNRVRPCVTRPPHDAVYGVKQRRVSLEDDGMSGGDTGRPAPGRADALGRRPTVGEGSATRGAGRADDTHQSYENA